VVAAVHRAGYRPHAPEGKRTTLAIGRGPTPEMIGHSHTLSAAQDVIPISKPHKLASLEATVLRWNTRGGEAMAVAGPCRVEGRERTLTARYIKKSLKCFGVGPSSLKPGLIASRAWARTGWKSWHKPVGQPACPS